MMPSSSLNPVSKGPTVYEAQSGGLPFGDLTPTQNVPSSPVVTVCPAHWIYGAYSAGVRENYAGMGSVVRHTPVHPAYALFGLPSIVTVPLASP